MGRQSMPVRHNSRNWLRRSLYGLLIVFLAVLIAAVCIFSVVNANGLQTAVDRRTKAYVSDVTFQMAQNIDAQLANVMQTLEMLKDSLVRIDGAEHRMDFLKQRAQMLGFTQLVLCDVEGEGICTDASTHNFSGLPGFEASAAGERGVSFLENQRILYTVPIVYEGSIFGVLAGERDKANMQALIATDGFDGNSVSCIIDRDSNVVISPTNLDFFFALDDLFVANKDPELASAVREMQANMQAKSQPHTGCPGSMARSIEHAPVNQPASFIPMPSQLRQWPVQIKLVPVNAPYFDGANLLIAADCTAYAYANFHQDFIRGKVTLVGCPKLDDVDYSEKLTEILRQNNIKSVTVVRMEVPCCGGLEYAVRTALQNCGKLLPWQVKTISIKGELLDD